MNTPALTTLLGALVMLLFKRNAFDGAIEAWFDRFVAADTDGGMAIEIASRRKEWWRAIVPLLRGIMALVLVVNICRIVLEPSALQESLTTITCLVIVVVVAFSITKEAHFANLYDAVGIALPALRYFFRAWPATGDGCFRMLLANALIVNTLVGAFMTPSFSKFTVWHLSPIAICALCSSAEHFPAMSQLQVGILCVSACVAVAVHQYAQARLRKHLLLQEREPERPPVSDVSDSSDDADLH